MNFVRECDILVIENLQIAENSQLFFFFVFDCCNMVDFGLGKLVEKSKIH